MKPFLMGKIWKYICLKKKELYTNAYGVTFEKLGSVYILGGDALMSEEQAKEFGASTSGRASGLTSNLWPGGVVYFVLKDWPNGANPYPKNLTSKLFFALSDAICDYHDFTGVEFRLTTPNAVRDYVEIIVGEGSWSYLGRQGGKQQLCLDPNWANKGTVLHEFGHAIGLMHEQCREDRDNFINILYNNIQLDKRRNFDVIRSPQFMSAYFDCGSVMMYGSFNSFAINTSQPTMTRKDGTTWSAQRSELSFEDWAVIDGLYPYPRNGNCINWPADIYPKN